jgi:hypothetical protein
MHNYTNKKFYGPHSRGGSNYGRSYIGDPMKAYNKIHPAYWFVAGFVALYFVAQFLR